MFVNLNELTPYITYITPPVVGAFIGYLTNRVAIRMLFRPLKRWNFIGINIPMTPGVIPSKRHELAINIGEMVGEHLLTGDEIRNSLQKPGFQDHLYQLIEAKLGSLMKKDLGPLASLVPTEYNSYFDIARKTVTYQTKEIVSNYLAAEQCSETIEQGVADWLDTIYERELNTVISSGQRERFYQSLSIQVHRLLRHGSVEPWIKEYLDRKIEELSRTEVKCNELLPQSVMTAIIDLIDDQTPQILVHGVKMLYEPEIQQQIIKTILKGIEEFIETLGPMAAMVQNYLDMDMVEGKIRDYFNDKEEEITEMVCSKEVRVRVSEALTQRAEDFFKSPVTSIIEQQTEDQLGNFSSEVASILAELLKTAESAGVVNSLLISHLEQQIDSGNKTIGHILNEFLGKNSGYKSKIWLTEEIIKMVQSQKTRKIVDQILEKMIDRLLQKPVGRLSNIVPAGVRKGLYKSLQEMATRMLSSEVPGIVKSLNLRQIVTDRIDSFDLLRLENLLLSIMQEQFKYINIFGGILGFLIGCANVIVITGIR